LFAYTRSLARCRAQNIAICKKYLERMAKVNVALEFELGVTGGEEDGEGCSVCVAVCVFCSVCVAAFECDLGVT